MSKLTVYESDGSAGYSPGEHMCGESGTPPCAACHDGHKCVCNATPMPPCAYCASGLGTEDW